MDDFNCEVKVAVLEERVESFERVFSRLDTAIDRIVEVNTNVSKMLAVHEERLGKQEKVDEVLFNKIDQLRDEVSRDHAGLLQRLQLLERKLWAAIGGIAVISFLGGGGPGMIMKVLQASDIRGRMDEVRPVSLELHRHEIYQSGFGSSDQVL